MRAEGDSSFHAGYTLQSAGRIIRMSRKISRGEQEAILRRAIIAAIPDFFSWSDEEKEKYKAHQDWKDNFTFHKIIFKELFGFKAGTQEELDEYYDTLSINDSLLFNQTILPMHGIGENNFFLNESFENGKSLLDFETLYDYDYYDHCYQEKAREREFEKYIVKPYRGSLYGTWARLEFDGEFTYASLYMVSSYIIYSAVEDFAFEILEKLIPHKYVPGKNHMKEQKNGGYLWDQRIDAEGKEGLLEELKERLWQYFIARFENISDLNNKKSFGKVYLLENSEVDNDPHISFLFSDISALKEIHFKKFVRDVKERTGDAQEVYDEIEKEKKLVKKFIDNSFNEIMQNYNPKILKLKKKRKIVFTKQAMKDFENI